MAVCAKCNKELSDVAKFCDACGTPVPAVPETEAPPAETPVVEVPAKKENIVKKLIGKVPKKVLLFGGIGLAAVVFITLLIVIISSIFGGNKENNFSLYIKDKELFYTDLKKNSDSWQLSNRFVDSDTFSDEELANYGSLFGLMSYMSEDGELIFFPDKLGNSGYGFNLYYRKVNKPKADAVKIDSNVTSYSVNESATTVTYIKGEDGSLFKYNIRKDEKEKIANNVEDFNVSADGNKICYINDEGDIYLKNKKKDAEKIAGEASKLVYLTENFKTVYYIKDDALYKQVSGKDRVKVASDVYEVIKIYESGEIYYLQKGSEEISLMDYVTDDLKAADDAMVEPVAPDYPSYYDFDSYDEYQAAYEEYRAKYKEYQEDLNVWWEKESRDELRKDLEEAVLENAQYSLYFFDGKEAFSITDAFVYDYSHDIATKKPVITYAAYSQSSVNKVKFSEVDSSYDVRNMVEAALYSSSEKYVAVKNNATVIEQEDATSFIINKSGTTIYYIDEIPEGESHGELYKITIKGDNVKAPELYESDVWKNACSFVSDSDIIYFKDVNAEQGDLYINKERVDYDVLGAYIKFNPDSEQVFYFTDWDSEKEQGTLKVYKNGKAKKIADDVHSYSMVPDGRLLYLYDYSLNHNSGELHAWKKGKTYKIDDDVVCIVPVLSTKMK